VRDLNPSGQHQLRDVTQAHTEAVIQPHATTNDLRRESIAFVERWSGRRLGHGGIRADRKRLDNADVATLSVSMISSMVAPRAKAPLIWRRVPGANMCVIEASNAMLSSSTNFGWRVLPS
jgi:hypothetical protein